VGVHEGVERASQLDRYPVSGFRRFVVVLVDRSSIADADERRVFVSKVLHSGIGETIARR